MLHIDDANQTSARQDRHGKKRLKRVLRKVLEELKARIAQGARIDRDRFLMLRNPSSNSLPYTQTEVINHIRMGVLRRAQHQPLTLKHINEARVASQQRLNEADDLIEHRVQRIRRGHPATNIMHQPDRVLLLQLLLPSRLTLRYIVSNRRIHYLDSRLAGRPRQLWSQRLR